MSIFGIAYVVFTQGGHNLPCSNSLQSRDGFGLLKAALVSSEAGNSSRISCPITAAAMWQLSSCLMNKHGAHGFFFSFSFSYLSGKMHSSDMFMFICLLQNDYMQDKKKATSARKSGA